MSHELNALAGAYALDALDEDERAMFEEHVTTCADCADEVRGMRNTAAELSHIVAVAPPAALRGQVLATIGQVRPLPPVIDNVIDLRRARAGRSLWQLTAAACALIAIAASAWGYQQHRDAARNAVASGTCSVFDQRDAAATSGPIGANGRATVVYSNSAHCIALLAHGIPQPAAGKTYQLWAIAADGVAVSAGLFKPNPDGNVVINTAGDLSRAVRMGISVEPAGGSAKPTPGAIVATMDI